jgi:hypothetical protein
MWYHVGMQMSMNNTRSLVLAACLAGLLTTKVGAQDHNKLSSEESQAGYDLLFNGTDLSNWHSYRLNAVNGEWAVKTNAPLGPRIENLNPSSRLPILTNKKFTNFDLKIDVQTTAGGNSGIFTRYEEVATQPGNARSGPEFQVCGPNHDDCVGTTKHFGSCYDMFGVDPAIRTNWMNPPGQWNQVRIIAFDSNYVHYGNGKKLLEYKIGTQEFLTAYNRSKYVSDGNNGRYYHIHPGGILLQHHGEPGITFRNIKAKELTVHPLKLDFKDGKWPAVLDQGFTFGTPTGVKNSKEKKLLDGISTESVGSGLTLVRVAAEHSDFHAVHLDGRSIAFKKSAEGAYTLSRGDQAPGLVVVRVRAGGRLLSKLVSLQ